MGRFFRLIAYIANAAMYAPPAHLASQELTKLRINWVSLHGGVPSRKRGDLIARFRKDPNCKVFLSTDAGGVGLNLQSASAVLNFEPPWNPARLEQRIGRVHRLGQNQPVQVIHLLTEESIEERVWETLKLKKALFSGLFEATSDEVSFAKLGRKSALQVIKEVFADQPGRPKPVIFPEAPAQLAESGKPQKTAVQPGLARVISSPVNAQTEAAPELARPKEPESRADSHPSPPGLDARKAAGQLLEAGLNFLETLAPPTATAARSTDHSNAIERAFSFLVRTDPQSQRPLLTIPLPESLTAERVAGAIGGLLNKLAGLS